MYIQVGVLKTLICVKLTYILAFVLFMKYYKDVLNLRLQLVKPSLYHSLWFLDVYQLILDFIISYLLFMYSPCYHLFDEITLYYSYAD